MLFRDQHVLFFSLWNKSSVLVQHVKTKPDCVSERPVVMMSSCRDRCIFEIIGSTKRQNPFNSRFKKSPRWLCYSLSMLLWRSTSVTWSEGIRFVPLTPCFSVCSASQTSPPVLFAPHCAPVTVSIRASRASFRWSLVGLCVYYNAVKVAESRGAALFTSCRPQNIPASAEAEAPRAAEEELQTGSCWYLSIIRALFFHADEGFIDYQRVSSSSLPFPLTLTRRLSSLSGARWQTRRLIKGDLHGDAVQ